MGRGVRSQHTEVVKDFESKFSDFLNDDRVRWENMLVEEQNPSKHLDTDNQLSREVDIALVNGSEAYVLEIKTTQKAMNKGAKQVGDIVDFFEEAGYTTWGTHHLVERNEHMDSGELAWAIHKNFGGVFDKEDLDDMIEFQNSWGSFGYVRSALSRDLTNVDPHTKYHIESSPYDLRLLESRGIMESEDGRVYRFSPEYKDTIREGEEEHTFILEPTAYEKYDL